jgi:putative phosphoesterase
VAALEQVVGVISDTHGLLRPQALNELRGVDFIVHAGDVGGPEILESLRALAPVTVVRGNVDHGRWADHLAESEVLQVGAVLIYVLHDHAKLDLDPLKAGFSAVICGHSHRPSLENRDGVLFLNPGGAGPRRFDLPVSLAKIRVRGTELRAHVIELNL